MSAPASRTELIAWINELLNLNYTKIEQCGSGAVYAQIIDSIYGNVPLSKLNFSAKHDYEYISNFKVLQETFKKNRIDKPIPVERLIKCKMQDNLEFLQWIKKFWDTNYPGTPYDPDARRSGASAAPPPLHGSTTVGAARTTGARTTTSTTTGARRGGAVVGGPARVPRNGASGAGASAGVPNETIQALTAQMDEMKVSVDSLEKERDFYFTKLRDIEMIAQERLQLLADAAGEGADEEAASGGGEGEVLRQIQAILYSTEEGFEVPEGNEPLLDEEETF